MQLFRHPLAPAAGFLVLFALSRVVVAAIGVSPHVHLIHTHWQNLDLQVLHDDPLGSLWALHSQPPLWNGVLALVVAVTGPDYAAATQGVHALNMAMSGGAGLMMISVLGRMGFGPWMAAGLAFAALCMPAVVYYENFSFYPHLTFFLLAVFVVCVTRIERGGAWAPVFGAIGALVALAWTWALFHPLFVAGMSVMLVLWRGADARGWAAAGAAVVIAALPTVKNYATYHVPSASTWVGLNLMQTDVVASDAAQARCDFITAFDDGVARGSPDAHPAASAAYKTSGDPNLNHGGMAARGAECVGIVRDDILRDIPAWLNGRAQALVRSHQGLPYNYDMDPAGWEKMAWLEDAQEAMGAAGRTLVIALYLGLWFWGLRHAARGPQRMMHAALMLTAAYFTLTAHLLNGSEQERMRYTIEPIYLLLTAEIIRAAMAIRRAPVPAVA